MTIANERVVKVLRYSFISQSSPDYRFIVCLKDKKKSNGLHFTLFSEVRTSAFVFTLMITQELTIISFFFSRKTDIKARKKKVKRLLKYKGPGTRSTWDP